MYNILNFYILLQWTFSVSILCNQDRVMSINRGPVIYVRVSAEQWTEVPTLDTRESCIAAHQ